MERLRRLNGEIAGAPEGFDVFYGAPAIILVLAERGKGNPVEDGSLAIEMCIRDRCISARTSKEAV